MNISLGKTLTTALVATLAFIGAAAAGSGASKDDAVAMVKAAVTFIKEQGPEKAYPEITSKTGKFHDRDVYVVVYQLDGKLCVKERVELAAKQPSFWQDYKFVNPVDKKVEPKQMYCEKLDNTAVCAGIYKS